MSEAGERRRRLLADYAADSPVRPDEGRFLACSWSRC